MNDAFLKTHFQKKTLTEVLNSWFHQGTPAPPNDPFITTNLGHLLMQLEPLRAVCRQPLLLCGNVVAVWSLFPIRQACRGAGDGPNGTLSVFGATHPPPYASQNRTRGCVHATAPIRMRSCGTFILAYFNMESILYVRSTN